MQTPNPTALFKDHFSEHAGDYAAFRPEYPASLFEWLAGQAPGCQLAWDCATGNGQAAIRLAPHFRKVVATDASSQQIRHAKAHKGVEYRVEPAERSSLAPASVDLVTAGQAMHWFEHRPFFSEVDRVLRPGGAFAAWAYQLVYIDEHTDPFIENFYTKTLEGYWPPERRSLERGYRDIDLPFAEIRAPEFFMQSEWTLEALCNYLRTWSAVRRFRAVNGIDPVAELEKQLGRPWGAAGRARTVNWPLRLLVANKPA